jgi:hypothetical protein
LFSAIGELAAVGESATSDDFGSGHQELDAYVEADFHDELDAYVEADFHDEDARPARTLPLRTLPLRTRKPRTRGFGRGDSHHPRYILDALKGHDHNNGLPRNKNGSLKRENNKVEYLSGLIMRYFNVYEDENEGEQPSYEYYSFKNEIEKKVGIFLQTLPHIEAEGRLTKADVIDKACNNLLHEITSMVRYRSVKPQSKRPSKSTSKRR